MAPTSFPACYFPRVVHDIIKCKNLFILFAHLQRTKYINGKLLSQMLFFLASFSKGLQKYIFLHHFLTISTRITEKKFPLGKGLRRVFWVVNDSPHVIPRWNESTFAGKCGWGMGDQRDIF